MIAIVYSIYSKSVQASALDAGLMDNDAERYCIISSGFFPKITMPTRFTDQSATLIDNVFSTNIEER